MSELEQEIMLKDKKELKVTGVVSVQSATPTSIVCDTTLGGLGIKGKGLHVEKLDLEGKILLATGTIDEIKYVPVKKPLLKRILK